MATQDKFGDDRLKKSSGADPRVTRDSADVDRVHNDGTALSAEQRRRMLRQEFVQTILPPVPDMPGFHVCWLSTTNSTDPLHKRIQIGYQPVKASEIPGFEQQYRLSDGGQYDGCVACNEMLLFKVPNEIYQDLMMIYHHDIPLEQEQGIRDRVLGMNDVDSDGRRLGEVEGDFNALGRSPTRTPTFA